MTNSPDAHEFFRYLCSLGVELWVENGKLRYRCQRGVITAELRAQLKQQKQALLTIVAEYQGSRDVLDLAAEVFLDPQIFPASQQSLFPPQNIFITGATGYLGVFLLAELLQRTDSTIHCLVRSDDSESGLQRICQNLQKYSLYYPQHVDRIVALVGDLSSPKLGMDDATFARLAGQIDAIYHNGAIVDFVSPYARLKPTNVAGTQEIFRLACEERTKPVYYVSTLGIFLTSEAHPTEFLYERQIPQHPQKIYLGYAQSKWVAEKIALVARARGVPTCIYRPAIVSHCRHSQIGNPDDIMARMIRGCIQLGKAPELDCIVDMVPVDYVSRAIVSLSLQKDNLDKTFHLANDNPTTWYNVVVEIRRYGYPLDLVPYRQWQQLLSRAVERGEHNALAPLQPLFREDSDHLFAQSRRADCYNAQKGLGQQGITCLPLEAGFIQEYLRFLDTFIEV